MAAAYVTCAAGGAAAAGGVAAAAVCVVVCITLLLQDVIFSPGPNLRPCRVANDCSTVRLKPTGVPDPTQTQPYETKHKIWSKMCLIPDKIPDFLGTRIRFTRYPTFLYPAPPLLPSNIYMV